MADTRILHKRGSFGKRVIALDHLEYRVWVQYVLSADDFGVMRNSASVLRADNPRLEQEPMRRVEKALTAIVSSGLIQQFAHQGVSFLWQNDWQDFQAVRHPRLTVHPMPPPDALANATAETLELFAKHPVFLRSGFGNISEMLQSLACARTRETLTQTQTQTLPEESARETTRGYRGSPHSRPSNLINGGEMRRHATHAWCSWPERDGLCVPVFLHDELAGRLGSEGAKAKLLAWYPAVVARFVGQAVPDALKFWRREFEAWASVAAGASGGGYDPDAGRRTREELARKREFPTAVSE